MGGRGAASGISVKGFEYGTEFKTLLRVDNIKFVQYNYGSATLPLETMSSGRNRVYVIVNKDNTIKSIGFYDKSGKKKRQIDLTHTHQGQNPHVHIGYNHSPFVVPLTKSDKAYIEKVGRIWSHQ